MARRSISGLPPQYAKNAGGASASGYWLKLYIVGTTTPKLMYTLDIGGSSLAKCKLNTRGETISNSSDDDSVFVPYVDGPYKAILYATETDADADNTANALWTCDNIDNTSSAGYQTIVAAEFATVSTLISGTPINALGSIDWSDYLGRNVATTVHNTTSNDGGARYTIVNVNPGNLSALIGGVWVGINHDLGGGYYAKLVVSGPINVCSVGINNNNTTGDDEGAWNNMVANNSINADWYAPAGSYRMSVFRMRENALTAHRSAVFNVFYGGVTPVMGQINSGARLTNVNLNCTETNLALSRCSMENANNVVWDGGSIQGFRDTVAPVDAWGLYLKNTTNATIRNVGFDNNDQSDIAIVGNCENITIDQCRPISSTLHINFEPNTSTDIDKNITLRSMDLSKLALLENGSGGSAGNNITVESCSIGTLKYDGTRATLVSCSADSFEVETNLFFGQLRLINTLCIGPNLIDDPYMINVGQTSGQAVTDSNSWYLNSVSAITNYRDNLEESGVRFTRINPDLVTGRVNFRPTVPISATAGDYYLVAMTGRRNSGGSGQFIQIFDSANDKSGYVWRQSNFGSNHFTTEMIVVPASATSDFLVKVGLYFNSNVSCDFYSISVHKVFSGLASNADEVLRDIHSIKSGPRDSIVDAIPVMSSSIANGYIIGDTLTLSTTGNKFYFDGTSFIPYNGEASDSAANIASVASDINTNNKYSGKKVWDTTNNRMLRAGGSADADLWYIVDGSGSVTPV